MNQSELIRRFFLNRSDKLANLAPWNRPCPIDARDVLLSVIDAHLVRQNFNALHLLSDGIPTYSRIRRVGSYTPDTDNKTKWLCIDVDDEQHSNGIANAREVAIEIHAQFTRLGAHAYLERSGGGRGYHVWVFFSEKIPAFHARAFGFLGVPERLHEAAEACHGVEVFPKSERITKDGLGGMVWLPWWAGAKEGCAQFFELGKGGWYLYVPTDFATTDGDEVIGMTPVPPKPKRKPRTPGRDSADRWASWRAEALDRLDLSYVYGDLLTGKRKKGFLECRLIGEDDPHPSASVATGEGIAERGTYKSFRTGARGVRIFDFMMDNGMAIDLPDAQRQVADWSGVPRPFEKKGRR